METNIVTIAETLNDLAPKYKIGKLQEIREKIHKKKPLTKKLFSERTIKENEKDKDWGYAFHSGGRSEIQFNIAFESDIFRYGLAFSFEIGPNFHDISVLYPKANTFNKLLEDKPQLFLDYKMWSFVGDAPHSSRNQGVYKINTEEIIPPTFIFFGKFVELDKIDCDDILKTFDKMLPIYEYVETEGKN